MSIAYKVAAVSLIVAAGAVPATAQNINADPNYETIRLNGGFSPDPYAINLQSGGSINAANISSSCRGYISNAPDVRLFWSSGSLPLIISVASSSDTTLVVNAPDGSWYCDDDGGVNGLNPALRWNSPMSGRYEIWVGTYGSSSLRSATLHISELYSQ